MMKAAKIRAARLKKRTAIRVRTKVDENFDTHTTEIRLAPEVEVGMLDGHLCFWVPGREIRIGPLSPEQALKLCEDLGDEAVL